MNTRILVVDDDATTRKLMSARLERQHCSVIQADGGREGLTLALETSPDLILLDLHMPDMNGYQVCERLQRQAGRSPIPVVFVTSADEVQDKLKAFSSGAVDYLTKPCSEEDLVRILETHGKNVSASDNDHGNAANSGPLPMDAISFLDFQAYLAEKLSLNLECLKQLSHLKPEDVYDFAKGQGIPSAQLAQFIAGYLGAKYTPFIDPQELELGVLPLQFCRFNGIVPLRRRDGECLFALSNPFRLDLLDALAGMPDRALVITEPSTLAPLFDAEEGETETNHPLASRGTVPTGIQGDLQRDHARTEFPDPTNQETQTMDRERRQRLILGESDPKRPVERISNNLLRRAIMARASDVHVEPKEKEVKVRFRVDGEMEDVFSMEPATGVKVLSRLKVLAGLDITVKRRPQDGAFDMVMDAREFRCRVATTSTPNGESMVMRILEPQAKAKTFQELGMSSDQEQLMDSLGERQTGLILLVGPTGSGKSTTVYSLLSSMATGERSLMSVEDPVEYRIANANQQQVNEKAGVTFEKLLKSAVRQDPDVFFLGEMRDSFSAKVAVEAASTGHLVVSTLHTSNAATGIFRLEMLGITRWQMAESVLAIVAQRLVRALCPHCKTDAAPSDEEKRELAKYGHELPELVGHPVGCPRCNQTGYLGREAVSEILEFTPAIAQMVRSGRSIPEIAAVMRAQGTESMADRALVKVAEKKLSADELVKKITADSLMTEEEPATASNETTAAEPTDTPSKETILAIDDDKVSLRMLSSLLEKQGYQVTCAEDGIDGLMCLGKHSFDLILSDLNMPNLDGYKLLEMLELKGVSTPVALLTAVEDDEVELNALAAGAADYIRKPFHKMDLLARVRKLLAESHSRQNRLAKTA